MKEYRIEHSLMPKDKTYMGMNRWMTARTLTGEVSEGLVRDVLDVEQRLNPGYTHRVMVREISEWTELRT